jgi:hypothetical protein
LYGAAKYPAGARPSKYIIIIIKPFHDGLESPGLVREVSNSVENAPAVDSPCSMEERQEAQTMRWNSPPAYVQKEMTEWIHNWKQNCWKTPQEGKVSNITP